MRGWGWLALVAALALSQAPANAAETALDRWVAQPQPAFAWRLEKTLEGPGYKAFVLRLTSQTWRTAADTDGSVWEHWLTIIRPDGAKADKAFLYITGGDRGDPAPAKVPPLPLRIALETGQVVAELDDVPNQPIRFTDTPAVAREEDDLIAETQVKFGATGDATWLVRLPMVNAGVKAMDAIQAFLASDAGGGLKINRFVVAGASKRGWTTWLVGAVDKRVEAIAPLVIDVLNTEPVMRHQLEALGFFTPAVGDYTAHGLIPHKLGTREMAANLAIEDPINYRDRLTMPKLVINAVGDEYFLPDNSRFYFPQLKGEKHLRYVPNANHSLAGTDALDTIIAFYESILTGAPRPEFSWTRARDGTITVRPKTRPTEVRLWQGTNPAARDFRVETLGRVFTSTVLTPRANGTYVARVAKPPRGYTASFVELTFPSGGKHPFKFTTDVSITPDTLPFTFEAAAKQYPPPKP